MTNIYAIKEDRPIEHTSYYGTTFKCESIQLRFPVKVTKHLPLSEEELCRDVFEFGMWYTHNIHANLSPKFGFSGSTSVKFEFVEEKPKNLKELLDNKDSFIGKTIINLDMGMSVCCVIESITSESTMMDQNICFHFKIGEKRDYWSISPHHSNISTQGFLGFDEPHIAINTTYSGKFVILL